MMSARCVAQTAASEQPLFHLIASVRAAGTEGQFAESLHQGIQTTAKIAMQNSLSNVLVAGQSALAVKTSRIGTAPSSVENALEINSKSQLHIDGAELPDASLNVNSDAAQIQQIMSDQHASAEKPIVLGEASSGIDTIEAQVHIVAQVSLAPDLHESTAARSTNVNVSKPSIKAATVIKKSKRETSSSRDAQGASSSVAQGFPLRESSFLVAKTVPSSVQCTSAFSEAPSNKASEREQGVSAAVHKKRGNTSAPASATPIDRDKTSSLEAKDAAKPVSSETEQVTAGNTHPETGNEAKSGIADTADLKEMSASAALKADSADTLAAPVNASGIMPNVGIPGSGIEDHQYRSESSSSASVLLSGQGEARTHSTDSVLLQAAPRVFLASQTALEVGVQSGTHGWLKIRAELTDTGVVKASLQTASFTTETNLRRELPGLTAYLQEEKVSLDALVVHPRAAAGDESRTVASGANEENGGRAQQEPSQGQPREQSFQRGRAENAPAIFPDDRSQGNGQEKLVTTTLHTAAKSWLSVLA